MLTTAQQVSMIQTTGGVAVVDVDSGESTYGHFEELPETLFETSEYGQVIESGPSVVVVKGALTYIGVRKGIDRIVKVDGDLYAVRRPMPGPDRDGGLIRLMLAEV